MQHRTTPLRATTGALASLRAEEIEASRAILRRADLLGDDTHVSYFGLLEQHKRTLLAGEVEPRRFRAMLVDMGSGAAHDVVVCPDEDRVVSVRRIEPAVDGQVPVVLLEFSLVEEVVHADERWREAMRRRGLTDLTQLRVNR